MPSLSQANWEQHVFMRDIRREIREMRKGIRALPTPEMRREARLKLSAFCKRFFPELRLLKWEARAENVGRDMERRR